MTDLSPEAIDRRFRRVAELRRRFLATPEGRAEQQQEYEKLLTNAVSPRVDMSPRGIDRRLRQVAELLALCRELGKAG